VCFDGQVVGVDRSAGMLERARAKVAAESAGPQPGRREADGSGIALARADAGRLPFLDATFDAVACLEGLEFTARPQESLDEMVRVLKYAPGLQPGGLGCTLLPWPPVWARAPRTRARTYGVGGHRERALADVL